MKSAWIFAALLGAAMAVSGASYADGDAGAGEKLAKKCKACHGAKGEGKKKNPPIAGMEEAAFSKLIADYKSGAKEHKMMQKTAKKLSDDDVANLAAYYKSLK
jgi:cytochrome c553